MDEAVADIEDTEEFENAYKKQEQRLFPFRTSSTEWTINGALGRSSSMLLVLPLQQQQQLQRHLAWVVELENRC